MKEPRERQTVTKSEASRFVLQQQMELLRLGMALLLALHVCNVAQMSDSKSDSRMYPVLEESAADDSGSKDADQVVDLPGQPANVSFRHYAGYITVNVTHQRALFYWLFEAASQPSSRPLVLWLNGGPGCSSVGYGQFEEVGPFRVNKDGASVSLNPYAWNNEVNLLFVESPAGVGFSYSNTSSDYAEFGDSLTARDSYAFLVGWLARFPEYKKRDFFIVGESYAGHYIPELSKQILDMNNTDIALKGIMMGNAIIDDALDSKGLVDYAWSHAIISDALYKNFSIACQGFSNDGISSQDCIDLFNNLFANQYMIIDIYSIFSNNCLSSPTKRIGTNIKQFSALNQSKKMQSIFLKRPQLAYDPCIDNYVSNYMNRADVQKALHAKETMWTACSELITNWVDSPPSTLPILKELMAYGIQIWYYSGDWDGRVPFISTQYSLESLNLPTKGDRYAWYYQKQVAGWAQLYNGITFSTIRGAGHMVPSFQPGRAFSLFTQFIARQDPPSF